MTKEELYEKAFNFGRKHSCESDVLEGYLDEFFETNVVIPKGTNRHPYADVLHEWIEGAEVLRKMGYDEWVSLRSPKWWFDHDEYRIKPSEPVYEWQWRCIDSDGYVMTLNHMTDSEFNRSRYSSDYWKKIEETKRVRQ